ncbi:MAG: hypothetical protein IKG69_11805 [Atopobiaceae bacterium]|nr:hypothetical protein [Atopobiaceae bacterium]
MANNLGGLVSKFTTRLDRVLEQGIKTGFLQINDEFLGDFVGVGEVKLPTVVVQGLGDYDRANGFAPGDATVTWTNYQLRYDRGREFSIDVMDDEEHLKLVSANTMAEFARTKVVPEVDAIRFAELSAGAGEVVSAGAITSGSDAVDAVLTMEEHFQGLGFELDGLVLNLTAGMNTLLRKAQPWRIEETTLVQGSGPDTRITTFDGMRLNVVPYSRFYTGIELLDGKTSGEEAGGYKKATDKYAATEDTACVAGKTYYTRSGSSPNYTYTAVQSPADADIASYYEKVQSAGKGLNFLVAAPGSATGITKHQTLRYFAPEVNQAKDAHLWQYRLFHDLLVYEQKKDLIYANVGV